MIGLIVPFLRDYGNTYLGIICSMFLLVAIPTDSVIIEAGIFYQSNPFAPPGWDVAAVVLIEVLAEEGCKKRKREDKQRVCFINSIRSTVNFFGYQFQPQ